MKKKYIDALFKNTLGPGVEATPGDGSWTALESRLDRHYRKRRFFFWLRTTAGITILGLAIFWLWPLSGTKPPTRYPMSRPAQGNEPNMHQTAPLDPRSSNLAEQTTSTKLSKPRKTLAKQQNEQTNVSVQTESDKRTTGPVQTEPGLATASAGTRTVKQKKASGETQPGKQTTAPAQTAPGRTKASVETGDHNQSLDSQKKTVNSVMKPVSPEHRANTNRRSDKQASPDSRDNNAANDAATIETSTDTIPGKTPGSGIKKSLKPKNGIYYGVILGPDISMIKSQGVKNLGYNIGGVLGYRFNSRWSVEAGIQWSKKKYYTDGKYFNKYAAGITAPELRSLNGGCEMFVFPIGMKYRFNIGNKPVFAGAGLNSYIMKKENYTYIANGSNSTYEGSRSYMNSGDHLFSNLQLSAGFDKQLSNKLALRIEPYFSVPLKSIGIGKIPITSMGITAGIMVDGKKR